MEIMDNAVFSASEFSMAEQGILSSDFLTKELETQVQKCVDRGSFLIRDEQCVNAYAYCEDQRNVVAISAGSIYKCLYTAGLFMLKDDFLPDVGDEDICYSSVTVVDYPLINSENGEILFYESEDEERRNIGQIITALALKYMVYHEIGHHVCGHLARVNDSFGISYGEANAESRSSLTAEEFQKIETEADLYAVGKILEELDELSSKWSQYFEVDLGHLELVQLLITALVVVKENLGTELNPVQNIENSRYLPKLIRLMLGVCTALLGDKCALLSEFREMLELAPNTKEVIEEYAGRQFTQDNEIELMWALFMYMSIHVVAAEQAYADIFFERHDPIVFQPDIMVGEWWERMEM